MSREPLPPLPRDFQGDVLLGGDSTRPWAGASGPFWRPPRAVFRPADSEAVAAAVGWAGEHGVPLIPRGGSTGMPGGNVGPHVILDLTSLDTIRVQDDGSVGAGAGAVAARVREAAGEDGRDLLALPSSAPWCTVGGIVSCNAAGARSLRLGSTRAWTREVTWVRADGQLETLRRGESGTGEWEELHRTLCRELPDPLPWPQVEKNSSGYALDAYLPTACALELAVGSEGTLGVVTEAVLETVRPPRETAVAVVGIPSMAALVETTLAVRELADVWACEYFGRRLVELGGLAREPELSDLQLDEGLLLVEVAGGADQVQAGLDALGRLAGYGMVTARDPQGRERLWELRHAASPTLARALDQGRRSTQFVEDSVVPLSRLGDYIRGLEEILQRHETDAVLFGHAGQGNLHVNPLMELAHPRWRERVRGILEETVTLVAELGGTLAGEHGDGRLRTPYLDRIFPAEVVQAFRTVKETLDPAGVLNPGVGVPIGDADPLAGLGLAPEFHLGTQGPERHR